MNPTLTCYIARHLLKEVGSPLRVTSDGYLERKPDIPSCMQGTDTFRREWFAYNLLRKRSDNSPAAYGKRKRAALRSFIASESKCKGSRSMSLGGLDRYSARVLLRAQQIMSDILGPCDGTWLELCEFTAGASTSRNRGSAHPALKYDISIIPHVTNLAVPYLQAYVASCPEAHRVALMYPGCYSTDSLCPVASDRPYYTVVPGAHLNLVPKDYETERVTLQEPDWNMFLQKGVGNHIRSRLKSLFGIDLNSQSRNQQLAYAGSCNGSVGTMDLKSASDLISLGFASFIIPADWYEVLYALRSPVYWSGKKWRKLEKLCSMGNGFTFELESAMFYSLAQAVVDVLQPTERRVSIFGDDIIVASSVCGYLAVILERCGFLVNSAKSYWGHVPFRESCGKHYHHGIDVSPVYVKEDLSDPFYLMQLVNQLRQWNGDVNLPVGRFRSDVELDILWVAQKLPAEYRNQVPLSYGPQSGLWYPGDCLDLCRLVLPQRRTRGAWYGTTYQFSAWVTTTRDVTSKWHSGSLWLRMHMTGYGNPDGNVGASVTGVAKKRVIRVPTGT